MNIMRMKIQPELRYNEDITNEGVYRSAGSKRGAIYVVLTLNFWVVTIMLVVSHTSKCIKGDITSERSSTRHSYKLNLRRLFVS